MLSECSLERSKRKLHARLTSFDCRFAVFGPLDTRTEPTLFAVISHGTQYKSE